ncbi:YbhB/YbcL family Raf kinase inhibitor-like protein [Pseudoduganella sp. GCM10020061]|uniref:YbhB/YbcL family Raf kinase inhibitor-like protein n=1 Tax=Pseudoduganella sp. GCM10020061 TaxID=3317345 RepID=UPI0036326E7A
MSLTLTSPDFEPGGSIPSVHTCEGADTSPALSWSGVPPGTKSLALIVDDPDAPDPAAPQRTWVHWVLYNIPPEATGLPAAVPPQDLPAGTRIGQNDWKDARYGGPCPPIGRHRYFFKLYALSDELSELGHVTKNHLEKAMDGLIIEQVELVGTYQKR